MESLHTDPSAGITSLVSSIFGPIISSSSQLIILQNKKSWSLLLEIIVLSADSGNLVDLALMCTRAALYDLKIPRTRGVAFQPTEMSTSGGSKQDVSGMKQLLKGGKSGTKLKESDFELESYWDEGDSLLGREELPVCLTCNLVGPSSLCLFAS